jgi:hypothetical protein
MKKILTIATMLLIGITASAQLQVGAGFMYEMVQGDYDTNLSGLYAGASYNIKIAGNFGVAPGVYYTVGNKRSDGWTTTDHNILVPVYLNYAFPVGPDAEFFVFAGPSANMGLVYDSHLKINTKARIEASNNNWYSGGDDAIIPRFDIKGGGGVGFKYSHFVFTVGYDYGFLERDDNHFNLLHAGFAYSF